MLRDWGHVGDIKNLLLSWLDVPLVIAARLVIFHDLELERGHLILLIGFLEVGFDRLKTHGDNKEVGL